MTDTSPTEPREPDNPAAWALAQHIADHPVSTIQAAFRYLNAPLAIELHEVPAAVEPPADQTTPSRRAGLRDRLAAAIRDAACKGDCGKSEEECAKERIQPFVWHHGRLAVVEGTPEQFADAVLPVLYREWPWLRAEVEDAEPADDIRDQLLHAIDHAYTRGVLGYGTPEELLAAYDTSRSTPADRAALRNRITTAVEQLYQTGAVYALGAGEAGRIADAVLAVLPEPTDRAAVLRWAADAIDATFTGPGLDRYTRYGADLLRRMADETATTETPCTCFVINEGGVHAGSCAKRAGETPAASSVQHAPGKAIRCPACRAKGYTVCLDEPAAGARQDEAQPDFTSPIAGRIEVRDPCPYCGDRQMIPRHQFAEHVARLHPDARQDGVQP
ncbi:hypothetical protein [Streptomyces griseoflavus]|uniref:hypothetical protein n=1 Tax=Streptomyces griseoflavus TaxID=35619 RepID=UPI00167CC354|nr:hypothetical protein [Streptomyces griseoflavus]